MSIKCILNKRTTLHSLSGGFPFVNIESSKSTQVHFSLSVRAGHFFDPQDIQGLSHLLEHMLFLGSRQQPAPNQLMQLIQKKGGTVNAWTSGEFANFHFSCPPDHFSNIIPAFLESIFHPLLSESMIAKEIDAIDAEFEFKRKDELRRLYQIHKETCNPEHPFSKFSVGNACLFKAHTMKTLREKLKAFHLRHYHKQNIRVAVCAAQLTQQDIITLTSSLESLPSGEKIQQKWPKLYRPQDLKILIKVKPLQQAKRLIVTFACQTKINLIENGLLYISHILGDESSGSLLAFLRAKGWATNLVAGGGIENENFKDFNINIQITDEGEYKLNAILSGLFYTLSLIRDNDELWRRQEKAQLDNLARKYSELPPSLDSICEYAESLFDENTSDTDHACTQQELALALHWMTIDNLRIKLISPNVESDKICEYYNAHYGVEPLPQSLLKACSNPQLIPNIELPSKNQFVLSSPTLVERNDSFRYPQLIDSGAEKKIWFSQDQAFNSVKGDLFCSFDIPTFCFSPRANVYKKLWLSAVNAYLQESLYKANIAGLHYRLYGHQCGFTIHCRGFTDSLLPLANQVLHHSFTHKISENLYNQAFDSQLKILTNSLLNKPINRLLSRLGVIIQKHNFAPALLLESLKSVSYNDFRQATQSAFDTVFCESMLHGNWRYQDAINWDKNIDKLNVNCTLNPISRDIVQLPAKQTLINEVYCEHDDAAVVLYLQAPTSSIEDTALCMIIEQLLAGPYFNALRTEQQLGYVVGTGYVPHSQHPGIVFYAQSPTHSPDELLSAIVTFLREQINDLVFYQNYWPAIRSNLLKQIAEPDNNLTVQSQRIWLNLATGDSQNSRRKNLLKTIKNLSFEALVHGVEVLIERHSFGELILFANGKFPSLDREIGFEISDITEFKASARFFQ